MKKMRHSNEAGFSKRGLMLVIGIVLAMGIVGLTLARGNDDTAQNSATSTITDGYVVIKQWGVRAPYDGKLTLSQTTEGDTATFSSKQMTEIDPACAGHGGMIVRYDRTDDIAPGGLGGVMAGNLPQGRGSFNLITSESGLADLDLNGTIYTYSYVGDHYYIYIADEGVCGATGTNTQVIHQATASAMRSLTKQLEPM